MLLHWQTAAAHLATIVLLVDGQRQERLGTNPTAGGERARLPIHNADDWLFTTSIGLGNPAQNFTAAIDIGWSDLFVPSSDCIKRPSSSCGHPLFNASASSTYSSLGRHSSLVHFGFYTSGEAAQDVLHLGGAATVPGQIFQETDDLRPTYIFDDTWYDVPLGLARSDVHSSQSNLSAKSPFQNLVRQNSLRRNIFVLDLPQTPADTGEVLVGDIGEQTHCAECTTAELPLQTSNPIVSPFPFDSYHSEHNKKHTYFLSGGWEVQPISATFGNVTFDLSSYTASFSSIQFWHNLPYAFASPVRNQLGVSDIDGSIDCDARSAGYPDLEFTFRGVGNGDGDTTHTLAMTPDDYIRETPLLPILDPQKCQVPIAMHGERDQDGNEMPKFIVLGNLFLRKFKSVFDADRESITLISK